MKKIFLSVLAILFFAAPALADLVNVQVRQVDVKSQPNYMSSNVGALSYGSQVETMDSQGNWYRISAPAGWIPKSAVTKRKVAVDADSKFAGRGLKHDEAALAGKGFSPQVEAEYKRQHPGMAAAYAQVDWLERQTIPQSQLEVFARTGQLSQ